MNIEISVIIPVYNVKEYLNRCIKSVLCQLSENSEIIIVDDGSTDGSGVLCDQLASMDGRIHVIHQDNHGVSNARNNGLRLASGKYITFIDPDDYVDENMIESMINCIESYYVDLVECSFSSFDDNFIFKDSGKNNYGYIDSENAQQFFLLRNNTISLFCWGKLYKREVIGELLFNESLRIGEDALFVFEYMNRMKNGVFVMQNCFYKYYIRNNSAVGNVYTKKKREDVESALLIGDKCKVAMENEWNVYYALTVFFAFASLLNTIKWREIKDFNDDYSFYKRHMHLISPSVLKSSCSRSVRLLWTLCRFSPLLYKLTLPLRRGGR